MTKSPAALPLHFSDPRRAARAYVAEISKDSPDQFTPHKWTSDDVVQAFRDGARWLRLFPSAKGKPVDGDPIEIIASLVDVLRRSDPEYVSEHRSEGARHCTDDELLRALRAAEAYLETRAPSDAAA